MNCSNCHKEMTDLDVEEYCHRCGEICCFACLRDEWCPACRRKDLVQALSRRIVQESCATIEESIKDQLKQLGVDYIECNIKHQVGGEAQLFHGEQMLLSWKSPLVTVSEGEKSFTLTWEVFV